MSRSPESFPWKPNLQTPESTSPAWRVHGRAVRQQGLGQRFLVGLDHIEERRAGRLVDIQPRRNGGSGAPGGGKGYRKMHVLFIRINVYYIYIYIYIYICV